MEIRLEKATKSDAEVILDIQKKAFMPLLEKYQDYETSPANENIERVISRIINPKGGFYKIVVNHTIVGAICVFWKEEAQFWISPMFILPQYQGQKIAQQAIYYLEEMFPHATIWELATLLEEQRNCYLYEKLGFKQTGVTKKINDQTTLVYYKKIC
ncbi:GNAT family N-acetyltransferase [Peribacillus alkalitolerans]|uniref:GNAT family N-acetyltransferase n=1 Tax=Peribacillus alkalitolerans TaxID=1550385 RepID=UPI0013D6557B|nr:GNAT family N-acetyltransferase [Peribacillus alkalitolerans]